MYLGMYYVSPLRQLLNQFTIPFLPPYSGTLAMYGTATGIANFETLVQLQMEGKQPPACAPGGTALIDFVNAAFPGIQVRGISGSADAIDAAFEDGTCQVYIIDAPIVRQMVLKRSLKGMCAYGGNGTKSGAAGGSPIGFIGDPMSFGLSHYAIGIRQDIDPSVVNTISYWMNILMSCNPNEPDSLCPDGGFAEFYKGQGGAGDECGYVLYPSSGVQLTAAQIAGIVLAAVFFVATCYTILHWRRTRRQEKRLRRASEATKIERELNDFIAHEVRNNTS